ncbi:MAG: 1-deoxy-D-xylulose-5-phosphate reductoisomerase, partial [Cutibacterium avidum]|nr:1-deoxy-D-xylulose-5-phosphate reductoisomerase [Cutibacterium avidum]
MKKVIILGSTGSIGTQTLEVIASRRDQFEVAGISAGGSDVGLLAQQVLDFSIPVVAIAREDAAEELMRALAVQAGSRDVPVPDPQILAGPEASTQLAGMPADVVCNAITGAAGLRPTL